MARVKATEDNLRHCHCPLCPVREKSECVKKTPEEKLYCAKGKTACSDFDHNEACICSSCLVWEENNLDSMYFCFRGEAE